MFGLSGEHLLVLLVILLIFGPKRLPDLGHSIGRTLKNFKDAMNGGGNDAVPPASQIPPQSASAP
ncbi:MAG: twin-arginine translocase TatA/TatE family subunit, partial [Bdellovibrionota bacterium]